jgi:hypothetical protein
MKKLLFSLLLLASSASAQTRDTVRLWKHDLSAALNLSQVSFTHWAAGGTNALSYLSSINGKSMREDTSTNWSTLYKLAFGQTKLGDDPIRKTDDELNLESVLTYKLGVHVNPYASLSFLSQFAPGYKYDPNDATMRTQVSGLFDPAYIKEAAGIAIKLSPHLLTRFGVALREILTNHFNSYADDPKTPEVETSKIEGGLENVIELELPVDDNVLLRAKSELFAPVKTLDRIILHGQASVIAKVSKYISTELGASVINEPDVSPFTQIKQGLSLGITYSVF